MSDEDRDLDIETDVSIHFSNQIFMISIILLMDSMEEQLANFFVGPNHERRREYKLINVINHLLK